MARPGSGPGSCGSARGPAAPGGQTQGPPGTHATTCPLRRSGLVGSPSAPTTDQSNTGVDS